MVLMIHKIDPIRSSSRGSILISECGRREYRVDGELFSTLRSRTNLWNQVTCRYCLKKKK